MTKKTTCRNCYCSERKNNPALAESMKDIPDGFCGICEVCGKPGHTNAHPHLPTTGSWCDEHWNELISHRVVNIPHFLFRIVLLAIVLVILYFTRDIVAELPLHFFAIFYSSECSEERFEGKSPTAVAILQHIKRECSAAHNEKDVLVNLKDFTSFKWDKVTFIAPYTLKMDIVRRVGLNGHVLACSKSGIYDEWTQLIFQLDGEIVTFFDISSYLLPFGYNRKSEYSIEDAQFSVTCSGAGFDSGHK